MRGPPIVLLPGLGCDARMYAPHRRRLPVLVPPWLPADSPHETLPAYARRMAATLPMCSGFILGGSSFGGMLAWEMAQHCRPAALVMIGSATGPNELAWWLRPQARAARWAPRGVAALVKPFAGPLARLSGLTDGSGQPLIAAMLGDCPADFVLWCARAIGAWQPSPPPAAPIFRLHGAADAAIIPQPGPGMTLVPRAGHMLDGGHAAVVIAWLTRIQATVPTRR